MRKTNLVYWISTGLFCAFLLLTSISYFTDPKFVGIYQHLGFPQYFRVELGIAKILGTAALLIPQVPARIKEWAYAGFGIALISGAIAHFNSHDPMGYVVNALFWLTLLIISYLFWHKRRGKRLTAAQV
jgi:uncharacterized membrane protein